jgi:hypothetical protein
MLGILSAMSLVCGVGVACAADYRPRHALAFERCGGGLLVAGLLMLGACLGAACPIAP